MQRRVLIAEGFDGRLVIGGDEERKFACYGIQGGRKGGEDICYVRAEMSVPEGRSRVRVRGGLVVMRLHCYEEVAGYGQVRIIYLWLTLVVQMVWGRIGRGRAEVFS